MIPLYRSDSIHVCNEYLLWLQLLFFNDHKGGFKSDLMHTDLNNNITVDINLSLRNITYTQVFSRMTSLSGGKVIQMKCIWSEIPSFN